MDTGCGLRRWQIDCYFGEDEPLGPGKFMGRPRATTFEYAYANARIAKLGEPIDRSAEFSWRSKLFHRIEKLYRAKSDRKNLGERRDRIVRRASSRSRFDPGQRTPRQLRARTRMQRRD